MRRFEFWSVVVSAMALSACAIASPDDADANNNLAPVLDQSSGAIAPKCDDGERHPAAPAQIDQFAFLIGDFDITSHIMTPNGWSPPRPGAHARWNGWWGLGGMMIYDEWYDPDPGYDPESPRGVNVRFFDDQASVWKMMWISDTGRRVQDMRAELREGKLTMWQVYPTEIELVADFTIEDEDHWYRVSYTKDEEGAWVPQYKLRATRIPCSS